MYFLFEHPFKITQRLLQTTCLTLLFHVKLRGVMDIAECFAHANIAATLNNHI